jgi:hypothetical protein
MMKVSLLMKYHFACWISAPARNFLWIVLLTAVASGAQTQPGQLAPAQKSDSEQNSQKPGPPTPMEFESRGLIYQALTKNGITVMYAPLPPHIKDFNIIQVTVTDGGLLTWTVRPADFTFIRQDGTVLQPVSADEVVYSLLQRASAADVIKLQLLYEDSIYAVPNFRSTNGYEKRREAAMAQFVNKGLKAAVAASAITFAATRLRPGDSTDGAVFFENRTKDKSLGAGRLVVHTCGESFEFFVVPEIKLH